MPAQVGLLSPKTVQCHVRVLKAFSFRLQKEGYTPENQLQNLKMPRAPVRLVEPLTPAEIKKVTTTDLSSRNGVRSQAIVVLALDSGLRAGEIAGITVGQMNLAAGFIKVMGKGAKERVVPIGEVQVVKTSSHL
jgi:site-specific recombinase XerD